MARTGSSTRSAAGGRRRSDRSAPARRKPVASADPEPVLHVNVLSVTPRAATGDDPVPRKDLKKVVKRLKKARRAAHAVGLPVQLDVRALQIAAGRDPVPAPSHSEPDGSSGGVSSGVAEPEPDPATAPDPGAAPAPAAAAPRKRPARTRAASAPTGTTKPREVPEATDSQAAPPRRRAVAATKRAASPRSALRRTPARPPS